MGRETRPPQLITVQKEGRIGLSAVKIETHIEIERRNSAGRTVGYPQVPPSVGTSLVRSSAASSDPVPRRPQGDPRRASIRARSTEGASTRATRRRGDQWSSASMGAPRPSTRTASRSITSSPIPSDDPLTKAECPAFSIRAENRVTSV